MRGTLGTHTRAARVQGGKLKTRHEIRIGALFRDAPEPMLRMIVAHELAHLKESEHNKAFYQLCEHLAAGYAQLEFDARVWLFGGRGCRTVERMEIKRLCI
ncbi:MAG: YgjP-like metallopeptidase domain-containing protein [Rivihabitans pingtungensis]